MRKKQTLKSVPTRLFFAAVILAASTFGVAQSANARINDDLFEQIVQQEIAKDDRIQNLNSDIEDKAGDVRELAERRDAYQQNIEEIQQQQLTLESQIDLLDERIQDTEAAIEEARIELEVLQLEIEALKIQIQISESDIDREKVILVELINNLYDFDQRTPLEITFQRGKTFSDFFSDMEYTNRIQTDVQETLDSLQRKKVLLKDRRSEIKGKKAEVSLKKTNLEADKDTLEEEELYKNQLLEESEQSEEKFQELYEQVRREQQQAEGEITSLEGTVQEKIENIRAKVLAKLQDDDKSNDDEVSQDEEDFLSGGPTNFSWPITGRYITCGFRCEGYPFRRIFEHSGIDIDQDQGSPVYAAASGYVTIAKFDGTSAFAYIRVDHGNGLSTVYAHLSCVSVSVDQFVSRGEVIGCSGGLPGTPGAGAYSTGDHLHFEVRVNGIPDDPLKYLPAA